MIALNVRRRVNGVVARRKFDEREKTRDRRLVGVDSETEAGEFAVRVVVILDRKAELFQVVRALHPTRGFAGGLHRREEEPDQNTDDGDDDQQFDESKTVETKFFSRHKTTSINNIKIKKGAGVKRRNDAEKKKEIESDFHFLILTDAASQVKRFCKKMTSNRNFVRNATQN